MSTVAIYIHPGFADWETGFITPELVKASFTIKTIAESDQPVMSMGSLTILPDQTIANTDWNAISLLILPGSQSWMDPLAHQPIMKVLSELSEKNIPVAAICGATLALARKGMLNNTRHTSNHLQFLKEAAPAYRGDHLYVNELAVCDNNLITASGLGALEFAREILNLLKVYDRDRVRQWYELFKHAVVPDWLTASQ